MATDHRGRPLASQGGAIPHLHRRALSDEQVYGEAAAYMTPEEKENIIQEYMGEPEEDMTGFQAGGKGSKILWHY